MIGAVLFCFNFGTIEGFVLAAALVGSCMAADATLGTIFAVFR